MKVKKRSRAQYLDAVAKKLQNAQEYLAFGALGPQRGQIRDDIGVQVTFSNILTIAGNMFDHKQGRDVVAETINNFSGTGYTDVADVQTVGAIDVTIMTLANSLVPYLAVDRSMANPVDTIYYQNLVAINSSGGVTEGDKVVDSFSPLNPAVTLGPGQKVLTATGSGSAITVDFSTYLVPGNVEVTITIGGTPFVGNDFGRDGKVYFAGYTGPAVSVNYKTGIVSLGAVANASPVSVKVLEDVSGTPDGDGILKIKADYVPTQLVSQPKTVIFEQNAHSTAYMNKILAQAQTVGGTADYTNLYFQRITSLYTEDINRDLIKTLVAMSVSDTNVTLLNLAGYTTTSFNATKDDLVNRFIIDMRTAFIGKTGVEPTVIVTGTKGAAELESNKDRWVRAPGFYAQQNGLAGTFDGVPVFRHNYLDHIETAGKATYYMGAKLPDNSSGSMVFGEYLPLVQTGQTGNFANPLQSSTGFFGQCGQKMIQANLCKKGQISYV